METGVVFIVIFHGFDFTSVRLEKLTELTDSISSPPSQRIKIQSADVQLLLLSL